MSFFIFQIKQHPKSKSTMYLNEDHLRPPSNHQGNIVRFLRSLVVSKSKIHNHKSRVFGKDLKQHLAETRNESKNFLGPFFGTFQEFTHATFLFQFRQF